MISPRHSLGALTAALLLAGCGQQASTPAQGGMSAEAPGQSVAAQGISATGQVHRRSAPVDCSFDNGLGRCHARVVVDQYGKPIATVTPAGYGPVQMRHAYGFDALSSTTYTGAGQTIAIVDAYNDPTIINDLGVFKKQYGITGCALNVVNQSGGGTLPTTNSGWAQEISLDVEWACAIAPNANILLVEANSAGNDLYTAVNYARTKANVVSMSWGGSETGATGNDPTFNHPGVSFVASSGDNGNGASYPATSPYVLAVGGTNLPLDATGKRTGPETTWTGSGGGISAAELLPGYQSAFGVTGSYRGFPDVAYNADPSTGVAVYDSTPNHGSSGWLVFGGTSAGAPQWAALIALADSGSNRIQGSGISTVNADGASPFYTIAGTAKAINSANYLDITSGTNGTCGVNCTAAVGYDLTTGVGSPVANVLVTNLK